MIMYLDDGIGGNKKYAEAAFLSCYIRKSVTDFGFLLASDKCQWEPVQVIVWLGYVFDTMSAKIFVANERIEKTYYFYAVCFWQVSKLENSGFAQLHYWKS